MTNPRRRHEIVATLSSLWAAHPELRFCQLIGYITECDDSFYMEDGEFYRKLLKKYTEAVEREDPMQAAIREVERYEAH